MPLLQVQARGRVQLLAVPRLHLLGAALCGTWVCSERIYARCGYGARGGRAGGLLCMPEATAGYLYGSMAPRPWLAGRRGGRLLAVLLHDDLLANIVFR